MKIYSSKDLQIISKNIDNIKYNSSIAQLKNVEPNLEERNKIFQEVLDFIKKKKLIIYGGYATHLLLNESIYDMKSQIADVDIYSYDPVNDMIELCNIIKNKYNELNVICKEAFHKDTFSLYVNYVNYLDITYVSKKILDHLRKIKYKDYYLIHPSLIILDLFRQFNDPLISYWRLEKSFYRFYLLNKKFNIVDYFSKKNQNILKEGTLEYLDENIFNKIKKLINKRNILYLGFYCYRFFTKHKINKIPYFEIFSFNYENDINFFKKNLKIIFKKVRTVKYKPFFQYINKKTIFYNENNELILIIYDHNNKCIPYFKTKNNENFISYLYFIQITFSLYIYYDYIHNNIHKNYMKNMIMNIIILKNNYFEKYKNKNILDKSIFQQFIIRCKGKTFLTHIEFLKNLQNKKINNFRRFNYIPSNDKLKNSKKVKYIYQNLDGLVEF